MNARRLKGIATIVVAIVCGSLLGDYLSDRLMLMQTDSIGYIAAYRNHDRLVRPGGHVTFVISHPLLAGGQPKLIAKKVGCSPGQKLETVGRRFFCDGHTLGVAKTHSRKGEKVEQFSFTGIIPEGYFFASGSSIDSLDSRYYGLVANERVVERITPLF